MEHPRATLQRIDAFLLDAYRFGNVSDKTGTHVEMLRGAAALLRFWLNCRAPLPVAAREWAFQVEYWVQYATKRMNYLEYAYLMQAR